MNEAACAPESGGWRTEKLPGHKNYDQACVRNELV
jgi:hypothetical protein